MAPQSLPQNVRNYLNNLDRDTAQDIIELLQDNEQRLSSRIVANMATKKAAPAKIQKKQANRKGSGSVSGGPKRPLNSWMAFRNYYSVLLANYTQKATSKVLTALWQADPFKAKWAILAKAYSLVRGRREKTEAPLDKFFSECAPLIGVIAPHEYLQCMGWQLGPLLGGDQIPNIVRMHIPILKDFPKEFTTTTLSAEDLVVHCYAVGYVSEPQLPTQNNEAQISLTMATESLKARPNDPGNQKFFQAVMGSLNTFTPLTVGQSTLQEAETEFLQMDPHHSLIDVFNPTTTFSTTFNPSALNATHGDGGLWHSFNVTDVPDLKSQSDDSPSSEEVERLWYAILDGTTTN